MLFTVISLQDFAQLDTFEADKFFDTFLLVWISCARTHRRRQYSYSIQFNVPLQTGSNQFLFVRYKLPLVYVCFRVCRQIDRYNVKIALKIH